MTSQRKIQANQSNARRTSGPITAEGKRKAARNSRKHGLASARQPAASADIERLVEALCDDDNDPALLAQARIVAENELVLRAVREQKLHIIERLREPSAVPSAASDNAVVQAEARLQEAKLAQKSIDVLVPQLAEKYKDQLPTAPADIDPQFYAEQILPDLLMGLLEPASSIEDRATGCGQQKVEQQQRHEFETLEAAAPDLVRLERYERRAWSRQQRGLYKFMNIKLTRTMARN